MISMILSTAVFSREDPNQTLTVQGGFLGEEYITYDVYSATTDLDYKLLESHTGGTDFWVDLKVGEKYLIVFTTQSGDMKCLYVDAEESGKFLLNVDFTSTSWGQLTYNERRHKYHLKAISKTKDAHGKKEG